MRLVVFTEKAPYKLEAGEKTYYLCMCGLSKNKPFCDGSHKRAKDEEEGKLYLYDQEGNELSSPEAVRKIHEYLEKGKNGTVEIKA